MTDNTQPEAREFTTSQYASTDCMIGAMRERIADLEAQLEAISAGGVSGLLVGSAAPPTAQAEGWRLVPVEPTQEMIDAMRSSVWLPACYRAMLAAAPTPPTSAEGVEHAD